MTHSSAELHAYYASRAPYYDAVYLKAERREDIAFLSRHLPERLAGKEVIEVACGTGYWTQHIAPAVSRMVATDGTAEPLEFARLRPGAEKVVFEQADAYALPADLGQFSAAFAGLWFSHIPVAARVPFLHGLHERMRPGARILFIDNNEVQLRDFPIAETDGDGNTYQHRKLRDGSMHRVLKNFPSESELRALLSPFASSITFRSLQNFWLAEYALRGAATSS